MLQKMRAKKNVIFSSLLGIVIVFSFQNCGQNMTPISSSSSTGLASGSTTTSLTPCTAGGCPQDSSYVQLEVANNNPISFLASGAAVQEQAVDISGYCNAGGYPGTRIYYSIQDLAGNLVVGTTPTAGTCDALGRFHFGLGISMLSGSTNYELNVILRAVDSTGVEYDNALGLNKRQVGLSPRTGI
jgi:hypothetical protein